MNLKQIRMARQLNQSETARRAGLSQSLVCRVENGLIDPPLSTLRRLAQALNCSVAELVGDDREGTSHDHT